MLINLRRRTWRVEDIAGEILTATPIDDFGSRPQQFLLDLERPEPGALSPPSVDALGDYALQRLFLQAVRLDALHGGAPFVSVQRTSVIPVEYQLVPLLMALRQQPVRLLIADTTGLGKTIEAGLVASELLARGRARSVLIITPANLREQWRQQMRDLFYLDFEIISGETRKRLERAIPPGADPWLYYDRLIVSIDYAKDIRIRPEIRKRQWDIVIVDECHNACMPHSKTGKKADMERWEAVDQIAASASGHLLLLSATPHNGYTDSYCSLLDMLGHGLVARNGADVRPVRERAMRHVCQRTRKDVAAWFAEAGQPFPFPEREPASDTEVAIDLHRDYYRILEKLDSVLDVIGLHARSAGQAQPAEWLRLHLHRRALSSPEALRKSLENRIEKLKQVAERPREEQEDDQSLLASLGDQGGSDVQSEDERDRGADTALLSVDQRLQMQYFAELLEQLRAVKPAKDRKLAALRDDVIPSLLACAGPRTPARIIVFTRFKDTLFYLEKELGRTADYEIVSLHGDLSEADRDLRFRQFAASKKAVLLATDVISEGINLQAVSCMVVHADIPYNPNRIDQRSGRVDRFGQRAPLVYIRTLYCRDTTDEDMLDLLVRKLERMRRDLGFCPPLFASEETVLRALTRRRSRRRTPDTAGQLSLFEGVEAEELFDQTAVDRMQSEGFYGQSDVRISDVSERLREVHRRFGTPEQVRTFIKSGLRRFGCTVDERRDGTLRIQVKNPRLRIAGLPDTIEKAVMDPEERSLHADATVLDVGHPLVRRLNSVIREEALRQSDTGARTSACRMKGQRGTLLLGHGLLRATASTAPPTLLEEMVTFGIRGGAAGFSLLTPTQVEEALAAEPSAASVSRDDALEMLQAMAAQPVWREALMVASEAAMDELRARRTAMRGELDADDGVGTTWLAGFDEVEEVGFDLTCITLLLPEAQ